MKKFEANCLEKVYELATSEFNCSITELEIDIIQQPSKGFLGFGKKNAIIQVCFKNNCRTYVQETKTFKNKDVRIQEVSERIEYSNKCEEKNFRQNQEKKESLCNVPKVESKEKIFDKFYNEDSSSEMAKIIIKKDKDKILKEVEDGIHLLFDNTLTLLEGIILLFGFFALVGWSIFAAIKGKGDALELEMEDELIEQDMSLKTGIIWLVIGLILLIASSRLLVWGAVGVATEFGVSDLIIGLTIVALGTSLPELAASIIAARKGEHDIAIGNVVGSNMFNILAVIGIAVVIAPMNNIPVEVLQRDWIVMLVLTIALLAMSYGFRAKNGVINRIEGIILILCYVAYNTYLGISLTGSL